MRLPRIFRTTAFRLALGYVALFVLSTAVLGASVYWAFDEFAHEQMEEAVKTQSTEFVEEQRGEIKDLREALLESFAWAGGVSLLLAVIGGLLTSAAFLRRLEAFNGTAARIIDGKLDQRVPLRGAGDEFDRLATNINTMLDRIQALMESMRQVSGNVAHDLRTPLSRLRQQLESAQSGSQDVATYQRAVEKALEECDQILSTFAALVRIAQIEAGSRRAGFANTDLSALCETIAETYIPVAEDNEQRLVANIDGGVTTFGDRELLTQMLANLIENAIRHTPRHTVVRLTLRRADRGEPVIELADNGPGIPVEARKSVFTRFYRLEASRSTPGSGLGLSTVAAIAELHGITLELGDAAPGLLVTLRFRSGVL